MLSRRNTWLGLTLMLAAALSTADEQKQDLQALANQVAEFVEEQLQNDPRLTQLSVKPIALDNRLKLAQCAAPVELEAHNVRADSTRATVKATCRQPTPWSLYISADVDGMALAAVATRSIGRGEQLSEADVVLSEKSISDLPSGYLTEPSAAVGLEARRTFTAGEVFRVSALKPPIVIKKGDAVVVEAGSNSIAVVAPGIALADGKVGQQIRVKNSRSDRTIKAMVVGPGRVEVRL